MLLYIFVGKMSGWNKWESFVKLVKKQSIREEGIRLLKIREDGAKGGFNKVVPAGTVGYARSDNSKELSKREKRLPKCTLCI